MILSYLIEGVHMGKTKGACKQRDVYYQKVDRLCDEIRISRWMKMMIQSRYSWIDRMETMRYLVESIWNAYFDGATKVQTPMSKALQSSDVAV